MKRGLVRALVAHSKYFHRISNLETTFSTRHWRVLSQGCQISWLASCPFQYQQPSNVHYLALQVFASFCWQYSCWWQSYVEIGPVVILELSLTQIYTLDKLSKTYRRVSFPAVSVNLIAKTGHRQLPLLAVNLEISRLKRLKTLDSF